MRPIHRLSSHPDADPVSALLEELRDEGARVRRRGLRVRLDLPAEAEARTRVLLLLGAAGGGGLLRGHELREAQDQVVLELTRLPAPGPTPPLDLDDPHDPRHYRHAAAFTSLLEHRGYEPRRDGFVLRVSLETEAALSDAYRLAGLIERATAEGLVVGELNGDDDEGGFEVTLHLDPDRAELPLYLAATSAEDYLAFAPEIERLELEWPAYGDPEALRELLTELSLVYYDERGPGSSISLRQHLLARSVRGERHQYRQAVRTGNREAIAQLWMHVFDIELDTALSFPEEHVIVSLAEPGGERHGLYLLEREAMADVLPPAALPETK